MAILQAQDHYRVLQVDPDAEAEVISAAYRRLAAKYHPDVNHTPQAAARMREINVAYDVLGDSERRAEYDRARGARVNAARTRAAASSSKQSSQTGIEAFARAIVGMVIAGVILNVLFSAVAGPGGKWLAAGAILVLILWKGGALMRSFRRP